MEEVEIPQYFICPISLQIMKDPVIVVTGITYDRDSIETWLSSNTTCPVTNQPLSKDSDLTPNHTLRRLLQAWCMMNASNGVDRIPTPKSPFNKLHMVKVLQDLQVPELQFSSLKMLVGLASENERNRRCMVDAGLVKVLVSIVKVLVHENRIQGLEEALTVLKIIVPLVTDGLGLILSDFCDSVSCILRRHEMNDKVKIQALASFKTFVESENSNVLDRLKLEFFQVLVQVLREGISHQANKLVLYILLGTCPWGRNKMKIIQTSVVFDLIEFELKSPTPNPDKRTTELVFGILDHLCSCADGRAQFLGHAAGIALVSKRIIRVSPLVDDRAVRILAWVCKFSATNEVLHEMLRVGAVSKLCMVLQAVCTPIVKEKARAVLRSHSNVWSNSPCISVYLVTRYPRLS